MRKRIIRCMSNIGVNTNDFDEEAKEDFQIDAYIKDSLMLVSFLVELECEFKVDFTDISILFDDIGSISKLCETLLEYTDK